MQNSSLKKQCTKPGTFSQPKRLKKGSGFLILCYFFVQVAIAFLFCNSPLFYFYFSWITGFCPVSNNFTLIVSKESATNPVIRYHLVADVIDTFQNIIQ